jgi:hypothetical protein
MTRFSLKFFGKVFGFSSRFPGMPAAFSVLWKRRLFHFIEFQSNTAQLCMAGW